MCLEGAVLVSRLPRLPLMQAIIGIAVVAALYLTYTTLRYVIHNHQLRQDEAQIRRDLTELDRDQAKLVAVRDYLASDAYVEDVARRILGLVKPGETLVVVSGSGGTPTPEPIRTPGAEWWKDLFGP